MLLSLTLWLSLANAAEVTDMAPGPGVLVGMHYGGSSLRGDLMEQETVVSGRRVLRHDLDLRAELAPVEGIALTLGLDTTPAWVFRYPDAREMTVEPANSEGSYLAGNPFDEDPAIRASGLRGVWVGAAVAPFAERYERASAPTTWRLDVAYRTGNKNRNLWTASDGRRGAAPGGSALLLSGAFSTDMGIGTPYMKVAWQREGAVEVDVVDEEGREWAKNLALRPASDLSIRSGVEILAYEEPEENSTFSFDLYLGGGYRTWEDIASGVYLPSVLGSSRQIPITVGDHMMGLAGVGIDYHVNEFVRGRSGLEFRYRTPFRPEHAYDVTTSANTWELGWSLTIQGVAKFTGVEPASAPPPTTGATLPASGPPASP